MSSDGSSSDNYRDPLLDDPYAIAVNDVEDTSFSAEETSIYLDEEIVSLEAASPGSVTRGLQSTLQANDVFEESLAW